MLLKSLISNFRALFFAAAMVSAVHAREVVFYNATTNAATVATGDDYFTVQPSGELPLIHRTGYFYLLGADTNVAVTVNLDLLAGGRSTLIGGRDGDGFPIVSVVEGRSKMDYWHWYIYGFTFGFVMMAWAWKVHRIKREFIGGDATD